MFIGQRIRCLRIERDLTLRELARRAEISSFSYLANIERGIVVDPGINAVSKIAKALEVSVDELLIK